MVPLLLQMSPRPSLTIFKANDSVLNDTKKTSRLLLQLFAIRQIPEAPLFLFFLLLPLLSSDLVKAYGPSADELEDLSVKLGKKWEELGRRLGFNLAAIDDFNEGNGGLVKKAFKMLMAWKQKEGSDATYKVLYDALCNEKVQCKLLAEEFCCDEIVGNASA